ncbi:uncharacterized protein LOC129762612 isoform X2 [Toxorhynchites rutilus septentrionalis]|uniref:uncharacterized protein LOC129762612 isoform X2 n=1 Tax=Toxorhynchites rutilus septentrionalis TaxID=329112 RepID=UPI002478CD6C|nr:uncharacterized protein LOC129762612 isoform X2 [Toxorhynchites rutilus septentrionalis]
MLLPYNELGQSCLVVEDCRQYAYTCDNQSRACDCSEGYRPDEPAKICVGDGATTTATASRMLTARDKRSVRANGNLDIPRWINGHVKCQQQEQQQPACSGRQCNFGCRRG